MSEEETVITFSDEDETATVHTHQRRVARLPISACSAWFSLRALG
jgi:hypothetical protein